MTSAPLILVIEDDESIQQLLSSLLLSANYRHEIASTGVKGLIQARQLKPDLILLDRQLPDMDGLEICRRVRKGSSVPIIMLTSLVQPDEKVSGLDSGANDYVAKPFDLSELLARIRVQLRDRRPIQNLIAWRELVINETLHQVSWQTRPIELTPKEYELLRLFLTSPEKVIERRSILPKIWGWESDGTDKVLDVTIHTLRQKMEAVTGQRLIHTVRSIGFILRAPEAGAK